jgi:CheY-like chemotaxis protein
MTSELNILIVDDCPDVRSLLKRALRLFGYDKVRGVADAEEAVAQFEKEAADVVLTDIHLPGEDGLALTQHIRERWPVCPVIVMTGLSDEESAIAALRAGACDYLKKPVSLDALHVLLRGVAQELESRKAKSLETLSVDHMEFELTIGNSIEDLGSLTGLLARDISPLLAGTTGFHLRIALQEMLMNAIEHGNLGISQADKADALIRGDYETLVEKRRSDPRYRDRRVTVRVSYDRARQFVEYRIADQGTGFDWRSRISQREHRHMSVAGGGRGILVACNLLPALTYNERGNEVILTLSVAGDRVQPLPHSS